MNIRIGMQYTQKELELELDDGKGDEVIDQITEAVKKDSGVLWLTDKKGRRVGMATSKISWIEVGAESEGRRVGFSAL